MRTEHADAMLRKTAAFCREQNMLPAGGTVLCAVSGGRDSMALLHVLGRLAETGNFQIAAAHFNHQLRPTASRDENFVRDWCREHGIRFLCGRGDVRARAAETGTGIEDAARSLRYRFLEQSAESIGAVKIATAHHRDDNAETVLLHLLRGTGLRGLCGIPPVRGRIIRPLLETGRADIDSYIAAYRIPYVEDETNGDAAYTRNRVRLEVLPLLEEISPGCTTRIAAAGALLREEEAHMQAEAGALLPAGMENEIILPVPLLNRQDAAVRRRLVRTMGQRLGVTPTREQVEMVLALGSGGSFDLPQNIRAVRLPHQLILQKCPPPLPEMLLRLGEQRWGPWRVTVRRSMEPAGQRPDTVALDADAGPLVIAVWDGTGRLAVENGSRTLKRLFMDQGIPVRRRREHPVLLREGRPAAAFGVAVDWNLRPRAGRPCLLVSLIPADSAGEEQ